MSDIVQAFYRHSLKSPQALALVVDEREWTYQNLAAIAQRMSQWLGAIPAQNPIRIGILGNRSLGSCAAVLAAGWVGGSFIPISLKLPEARLSTLLKISDLDALIADDQGVSLLSSNILEDCPDYILTTGVAQVSHPRKNVCDLHSLPESSRHHAPASVEAEEIAYTIFTSGTTGVPKGVEIPFRAIGQHVKAMQHIYALTDEDRVAQTSDLSFDISLSNIFVAWNVGAPLYVVPEGQIMAPAKFINKYEITFWFSVPSIIHFMQSMNFLLPGALPSLRCSVFAGEPLLLKSALAWKLAAPNSVVDNTYGPTEGTVLISS